MSNKIQITPKAKGSHLSSSQRAVIEIMLNEGFSIRHIAASLECSPSTISREIKRNATVHLTKANDCLNQSICKKKHVCGSSTCNQKCITCGKCKNYCEDYEKRTCLKLRNHNLCNGCSKFSTCHLDRIKYEADNAEKKYRNTLVNSRNGFDLTCEQIMTIDDLVTPLIKKGQSPYHIVQTFKDQLPISESTLRRMIKKNELSAKQVDLKEAVKRRKRIRHTMNEDSKIRLFKAGRMYVDYLDYISKNEVNVVEMDCVEGVKTDQSAILTLHFVNYHLQLYFIMLEHTSKCVIEVLDKIEAALGTKLFKEMFEVILTDNGHEFNNIEGMERSINNGQRTKIFFCEPNRSDEKGACERNHKILREIIPKGTSIDGLMQTDCTLITNNINSYKRKALGGKSPYDVAMFVFPEDFFTLLGLEKINAEDVNLTKSLLKK